MTGRVFPEMQNQLTGSIIIITVLYLIKVT